MRDSLVTLLNAAEMMFDIRPMPRLNPRARLDEPWAVWSLDHNGQPFRQVAACGSRDQAEEVLHRNARASLIVVEYRDGTWYGSTPLGRKGPECVGYTKARVINRMRQLIASRINSEIQEADAYHVAHR